MVNKAWRIAVVGAGPVGLALALHAARLLPQAHITLFDARPLERDVAGDARTLALALGSVQFLQRLSAWPAAAAQPITEVHVSQTPPSADAAEVHLRASELGVPLLGAVLPYGALVAPLQQAWLAEAALWPERLHTRFGIPVVGLKTLGRGVQAQVQVQVSIEHPAAEGSPAQPPVESGDCYDLAVVAEGGVFATQRSIQPGLEERSAKVVSDYRQTAWVGTVTLEGATPGMAFERFTRHGPAALLPLPAAADGRARAALVWCVPTADDPVRDLDDAQRLAVLGTIFPATAGRIVAISPLKHFALGLDARRTLVQGRSVRIGNAAQTLHPVAGQGLNLGLRDAHELVSLLRREGDIDGALRRAEWARAADRWTMIAATDFLARSFTWTLPGAATARGFGLAALQALPPLKGWLARRMMYGGR